MSHQLPPCAWCRKRECKSIERGEARDRARKRSLLRVLAAATRWSLQARRPSRCDEGDRLARRENRPRRCAEAGISRGQLRRRAGSQPVPASNASARSAISAFLRLAIFAAACAFSPSVTTSAILHLRDSAENTPSRSATTNARGRAVRPRRGGRRRDWFPPPQIALCQGPERGRQTRPRPSTN